MLRKVYAKDESIEEIVIFLQQTSQKETSKVSLKEACFNPKYLTGTWLTIILISFHELTGYNAIMLYSNTILKEMFGDSSSGFTPRTGSCLIGATALVSCVLSVYVLKIFRRRTLLIPGHFFMAGAHALIGLCTFLGYNTAALVMIMIFVLLYQNMNGALAWVYSSEVVVDSALGLVTSILWLWVLVLSLSTNYLMESAL